MRSEIISIGTEILLGEITDTNASYLAGQLPLLGIDLYWISQVGDNQNRLVEVLERAWQRSDLIITGGGLGPTEDDITREAIAKMLGEEMTIEPTLENGLRQRFAQMSAEMPLSNLRQATIIPSAQPIRNTQGTAPGWWVEKDDRILVAMPGPSLEMHEMWQKEVRPRLRQSAEAIIVSRTFKTFGLAEATIGEMVTPIISSTNPTLAVYTKADGIHLRLTAKAESQQQAEKMIAGIEVSVRAILGEYIWGTDDDTLEKTVGQLLMKKGLSLAVMEDCSGGRLAGSISDTPGAPSFFKGGLVTCSDEAKLAFGVSAEIISQYGAVSPEAAQAMAEAARAFLKADIGISVTGTEETGSGSAGTVYIGIADSKGSKAISRIRRRRITASALSELRKSLISLG